MSKRHDNKALNDGTVIHVTTDEKWGTIFTSTGEKTIKSVSPPSGSCGASGKQAALGPHPGSANPGAFNEEDYFEKVRAKATSMASQILADARTNAEALMHEAQTQSQNILTEAHTQGYNEGFAKGHEEGSAKGYDEAYQRSLDETKEELDALRSNMADSVSAVVSAIEEQTDSIYESWRNDIVAVCKLAVEKISAVQLSEERATSLSALLSEAIATLKKDRRLVIFVNPEDEPVISDIIESTKAKYPDITTWDVRPNADITPGGLVMESEYSLAESLVESRQAAVNTVLSHLTLSKPS